MSAVVEVINNRIRARGVTLVFVGKQANMKPDLLGKTLAGDRKLKADEFVNLCRVLDLTLDDFKPQTPQAVNQ